MRPNKLYNFNEKISMKSKKLRIVDFFLDLWIKTPKQLFLALNNCKAISFQQKIERK